MYFSRVFWTTSSGKVGTGGCLFHLILDQIVPDKLFVERILGPPGLVRGLVPKPRGVRREGFVDPNNFSVPFAELKFGVGQDKPAGFGVDRRGVKNREAHVPKALRQGSAPTSSTIRSNEIFSSCSPSGALVAGVKIGVGSFDDSCKPRRQFHPAHRLAFFDIPSTRTRPNSPAPRTRCPPVWLFSPERSALPSRRNARRMSSGKFATSVATKMVGANVRQFREPKIGGLAKDFPLSGTGVGKTKS
jgi:hypothetical protein